MRLRLKSVSLAIATLLLSLSPSLLPTPHFRLSASAQTSTTQSGKGAAERLLEQGNQQLNSFDDERNKAALQGFLKALEIARELPDRALEGKALSSIGEAYLFLSDSNQAIQYAQQSLAIARELPNRELEGASLSILGAAHIGKDAAKSLAYQQQALAIVRSLTNRPLEVKVLRRLGHTYRQQKDYLQAIDAYQQSLQVARAIRDRDSEKAALNQLSNAYQSLQQYPKVIEMMQELLRIAREESERPTEINLLANVGDIYYSNLKDNPKAIEYYQQALQIAQTIKRQDLQIDELLNIARSTYQIAKTPSDYQNAIKLAQRALKLAQEMKDVSRQGRALAIVGNVYNELKDYPKAIAVYEQSIVAAREANDSEREAAVLNLLAGLYKNQFNDHRKAIEYYQQALQVAEKRNERGEQVDALLNIAVASQKLAKSPSEYRQVIELAERGLKLAQEMKDASRQARALAILAITYGYLKDYPQAIAAYEHSITAAREANDSEREAAVLNGLAGLYNNQLNDYRKAIEYYQQALQVAEKLNDQKLQLDALLNIANSSWQIATSPSDYQKIIELAQRGLKLARDNNNRSGEARALAILGDAHQKLQEHTKAIEYYQQSIAAAREAKDQWREAKVLGAVGDVYSNSLNNYQKALEYYQQASQIAEKLPNPELQLDALLNIANSSWQIATSPSDYQKIIELAQRGVKLAQKTNNHSKEARALAILGDAHQKLQEHTKAIEYYQQSIAAAREAKDEWREAIVLGAVGDVYKNSLNDYQKALEYYQQELKIAREIKDANLEVQALNNLGLASQNAGNYTKGIEYLQQSLTLARELNDNQAEITTLGFLVDSYNQLKNYPKAIEFAQQFLIFTRNPEKKWNGNKKWLEAFILNAIGDIYNDSLKENRKAIEYYQQASQVAEKIQNRSLQLSALLGIALASHSLASSEADYQKVLELAQQGLKLARDEKDRSKEARALAILGMTYNSLNDFPKAIESWQQGVAAAKEAKEGYRASVLLNGISSIYYSSLRDYAKGIDYAQQALSLAQTIENVDAEANALSTLSDVYQVLGDYPKSIEYAQKLKTIAQKTNNRELESLAYLLLTFAYYGQNDPRIEEIARQNLIVAQNSKNPALEALAIWCLGWLAADSGDYTKAIEFAQRSLTIARNTQNRDLEEYAQRLLGNTYRKQGKADQAIAAYRSALATSDNAYYGSKVGLAEVYQDLHMPVTAIAYYKQAINQIETVRSKIRELSPDLQQSFLQAVNGLNRQRITDIYRQLADLLLSQGRIAEAQQVLELLRLKELDEFTRTARSGEKSQGIALSQVEANVLKEHGTLVAFGQKLIGCQSIHNASCDALRGQLTALTDQYNQAVRTLEKELSAHRSVDKEFIDPESQFGKAAANLIKENPGTLLIYPLVLEDKLWLLMAGPGGVLKKFEVNVSRKQLSETVRQFRDLLQTPNSDLAQLQSTSKQLYTWLIQPLEAELKTKNANQPAIHNLVFSLDRVTRYIPMAALFDGKQYLIENYTVSTLVAASLGNNHDRNPLTPQTSQVLALGVSQAQGFPPLPNVRAELDGIVRNPNNNNKGIYPGQEFLDQSFDFSVLQNNLNGHRILHIATHGKFEPGDPYSSYLVMGKGDRLKIADIQNLPYQSDLNLVTLSACETAMGGLGDGIEIAGISSFFLGKGAQAVNASLWLVNDASTSLLMQQFYRNLATGTEQAPMTKAEALRQAQLVLLKNPSLTKTDANRTVVQPITANQETRRDNQPSAPGFTHPYYWAPFILIGNSL